MRHQGGVAAAILKRAGQLLHDSCQEVIRRKGNVPIGSNLITKACGIKTADMVIHAVPPNFAEIPIEEAKKLLLQTYKKVFESAEMMRCNSLAFPLLSASML